MEISHGYYTNQSNVINPYNCNYYIFTTRMKDALVFKLSQQIFNFNFKNEKYYLVKLNIGGKIDVSSGPVSITFWGLPIINADTLGTHYINIVNSQYLIQFFDGMSMLECFNIKDFNTASLFGNILIVPIDFSVAKEQGTPTPMPTPMPTPVPTPMPTPMPTPTPKPPRG